MSEPRIKRTDPIPDFDYFADDQVLTAQQLNRGLRYFDRQHRQSRVHMAGIGILCGLHLSFDEDGVTLSRGAAITSDGDLLEVPRDRVLDRFKPFLDEDAQYPPFRNEGTQAIPLWELFEQNSGEPDLLPLNQIGAQDINEEDLVALLYLESWVRPYDICTGSDCDNRGPTQVGRLRVLLARRTDLQPEQPTPDQEYFALARIHVDRIQLNGTPVQRFDGGNGLAQRYLDAAGSIRAALGTAFTRMAGGSFGGEIARLQGTGPSWPERLAAPPFSPAGQDAGVQYVYGATRDLADAYNEWRESLFELGTACVPDPGLYPKHILIGELVPLDAPDGYRHRFRASPGRAEQERLEQCLFLLRRIDAMLRFFAVRLMSSTTEIRFTPTCSPRRPLGERAIPYYYEASDAQPLHRLWSWELTRRRRATDIPSYSMANYNAGAATGSFPLAPLHFELEGFDFVRIEGHINQDVQQVQARLESLARQHNLAFKVESIQIEDQPDQVLLPPRIRFFDIESLFHLYRTDFSYTLKSARDFSTRMETQVLTQTEVTAHTKGESARDNARRLGQQLDATMQQIPRSFTEFTPQRMQTFKATLDIGFPTAERLTADVRDITRPTSLTPVQKFADGNKFVQFGVLQDILDKRRRKVRERSIFARFVTDHPGLEHLGGVWRGGTFVLVYAADGRRVLADFCLPYFACCDLNELEPEEVHTDPPDDSVDIPIDRPPFVFDPPNWWNFNKNPVFTLQGPEVLTRFEKVNTEIVQTETKLSNRVDDQIGLVNATFSGFSTGGGFARDSGFGKGAGGAGGVSAPGVNFLDDRQGYLAREINGKIGEKQAIEARIGTGVKISGDAERIQTLENEVAELVVVGAQLDSVRKGDAELNSGDRAFVEVMRNASLELNDSGAKSTVGVQLERINAEQPNSLLTGKLGNLSPILR